jgi:fucose 4-O-acetylase-like acetyltransferase
MVNNRDFITVKFLPIPYELETRLFILLFFFFISGMFFGKNYFPKISFRKKRGKKKN